MSKRTRPAPAGWAPRVKLKGEATANTFDISVENYNPAKHNPPAPTRPGALDFTKIESKGYRT